MILLPALLWVEHLLLVGLAFAVLQPALSRIASRRTRLITQALCGILLLTPAAILAGGSVWLRFAMQLERSPWLGTSSLLILQSMAMLWLAQRAAGAAHFTLGSSRKLWIAVAVALVLEWTTLVNLQLQLQVEGARARLEAGQLAYRERPAPPEEASNAAPIYARLARELFEPGMPLDEDRWSVALQRRGDEDLAAPELRAALASCQTKLEDLRRATQLPRCSFNEDLEANFLTYQPVIAPMISLSAALALDARLCIAEGDLAGAFADINAVERIAVHLLDTPLMIHAIAAQAVRERAVELLPHALSAANLSSADLALLALSHGPPSAEVLRRALRMEEAYFVATLGSMAEKPLGLRAAFGWLEGGRFAEPALQLYFSLRFEHELRSYREAMAALDAASELDAQALRLARETGATRATRRDYANGLFASYASPSAQRVWPSLLRGEALSRLARAALAAARFRLEHATWPTRAEELGESASGVRLEGDGASLRLIALDPRLLEDPPSLNLPPAK